jgi:beta-lactamase regulating signal transducer with metallopeptidase domain
MTAALDWNAVAQMSAPRIMDCLIEGALIAVFTRFVLLLARRQSAGARFAVWFSALMAIAALPMLSGAWWWHEASTSARAIAGRATIVLPGSWALYLFAGWTVIAVWALLRVFAGLVNLRVLRNSCVSVDPNSLDAGLRETLARNQGSRPVALCVSDRVHVPTAIGFVKPVVVIPRWLLNELSPTELNQVLLHELAHLRRWDDWTNLAQKIVKALLFFHPAVWWIEKRISLEREMACDDAVLAQTASPRAYAECLARLAEKSFVRRGVALAQAAVGRIRQTSLRVAQILDVNRPSGKQPAWRPAVSLVAGFAMACVVCVSRAPRLVAFEDSSPVRVANAARLIASNTPSTASFERSSSGTVSPTAAIAHPVAWKTEISRRPARAAKTKSKPTSVVPGSNSVESFERASVTEQSSAEPGAEDDMVHPAGLRTSPMASSVVVFVIVGREYGSSGQAVYQISVWHVTLQRPADSPTSNIIPRKT